MSKNLSLQIHKSFNGIRRLKSPQHVLLRKFCVNFSRGPSVRLSEGSEMKVIPTNKKKVKNYLSKVDFLDSFFSSFIVYLASSCLSSQVSQRQMRTCKTCLYTSSIGHWEGSASVLFEFLEVFSSFLCFFWSFKV